MLIDTHILLWVFEDVAGNMGVKSRLQTKRDFGSCYVSMASFVEIKVKQRRGSLKQFSIVTLETNARLEGAAILDIQLKHLVEIPDREITPHADPFDLLLVAQAISEGLPLLTCDERILEITYPGLRLIDGRR